MKLQVTKLHITVGIVAAALMLALVFSSCGPEYIDVSEPEAKLLSLKVGDLVMPASRMPVPVLERDWIDDDFELFGAGFSTLAFKRDSDLLDARFYPTVSKGAKVKWGVANRTVRPSDFYDTRVPATFDERDFIYFQVISGDGKETNYYRFSTYMSSPVKELSSIAVAGREADMSTVWPDSTWNGELLATGTLHVTQAQASSAVIDAVPWAETSKVRFAVTNNTSSQPDFGSNNRLAFIDGQYLYVEVMAENTIDINFYRFRVYVGRIATIGKLSFISPVREAAEAGSGTFEALGKGIAINDWKNHGGAGSFDSPHQPEPTGFNFAVELEEVNGSWQYAKVSSLTNNEPAWITPPSKTATPTLHFTDGEYLAIKVIPPNRSAASPDYFYKVKIGLLAADFKVQPKSAVYDVDAASVTPLTFTLDRDDTGFTYQWYEANSWYGGYGFDSEGRIGEKAPLVAEAGWGDNDKGILNKTTDTITYYTRAQTLPAAGPDEIAFDVSAWYQIGLDEKDNVSLHNGGNQYYNLPIPGRPIAGATGKNYTPPVASANAPGSGKNRRPFITGFSNESHYYWVVATAPSGLRAVSARAVIVTEWGMQYHNGSPATDKDGNIMYVNKKHHLIDLYAYQTQGAYGLQKSPRNAVPFIKGNHGDEYYIPITFPPLKSASNPNGFDILDYSVFTAQALFYLADGREWIQNWTQGDIGFARNKNASDSASDPPIIEIVLWYNLTNDNATRGLASSGNEPSGGGLNEIPDYIVVKPAGTKPVKEMPPFQADRPENYDSAGRLKPLNNNNAQGWFTPYIELCEIRFEGPDRHKVEGPECECDGDVDECTCPEDECDCDECE
jgi:hypothetical protein